MTLSDNFTREILSVLEHNKDLGFSDVAEIGSRIKAADSTLSFSDQELEAALNTLYDQRDIESIKLTFGDTGQNDFEAIGLTAQGRELLARLT
ncbi:hypothetical protein [Macrococcus equipercicus]|uniref:Uncharacterized protein n=1 Tax=Macrococcus equipercicus TaxID=69967 RepID=A0A9Q9F236_9STAP|nr:hypothetical protein [Macrococcus equipercicus]KAA1042534.1 hypothetical protein ERX35_001235 [Macrococcus equipercicus]UTH14395.1 hypothetical protein KFV11_03270 [Macrococcus equipercicus]